MTTPQDSDSDRFDRIERNLEKVANDLATVVDDVKRISDDVKKISDDQAVMKGWQTELVVERRARAIFRRLCGGNLLRIYPDAELQHYIGYHRHIGVMSEDEFIRAGSADFLLEGTDSHGAAVMYAVEVSYTIGVDDSDRAIDKAALLTRALGREVRPAVVGETATAQFEADAAHRNIAYTFIGNGRDILR